MPGNTDPMERNCPMDRLLRGLMGPWTAYVVWVLSDQGPLRFGELKRQVPGISAKVLTQRLRSLESAGLIFRDYKPTVPPEVTYGLTRRGGELKEVLGALHTLALRWDEEDAGGAPRQTSMSPTKRACSWM